MRRGEKSDMKFQNARFIKTVVDSKGIPFFSNLPEIALLGRSNVGKSTLLNHLFNSKNLAKTSSTPGKTRALNFFNIDEKMIFVDMPGFGYAAVSPLEKKRWGTLIESYLNERPSLRVLLYLFDIRRIPDEMDERMLAWIAFRNIKTVLILTKVDKLNHGERMAQTKRITTQFKEIPYIHYSALKNEGRKELIAKLREMIDVT
jgi:GTP-binding protein